MIVTPRRGVWIEIGMNLFFKSWCAKSLPAGECGLKYIKTYAGMVDKAVTPRRGVWIEIVVAGSSLLHEVVTPRRGVWIEILLYSALFCLMQCHSPQGSVD